MGKSKTLRGNYILFRYVIEESLKDHINSPRWGDAEWSIF